MQIYLENKLQGRSKEQETFSLQQLNDDLLSGIYTHAHSINSITLRIALLQMLD